MQHVYVIGSKGIPGSYGGYETFLDKLTEYHQNNRDIQYHVACKANGEGVSDELNAMPERFEYHNADCFKVQVPEVGSAQAIIYDCLSFAHCIKHIKENKIDAINLFLIIFLIFFIIYFSRICIHQEF